MILERKMSETDFGEVMDEVVADVLVLCVHVDISSCRGSIEEDTQESGMAASLC